MWSGRVRESVCDGFGLIGAFICSDSMFGLWRRGNLVFFGTLGVPTSSPNISDQKLNLVQNYKPPRGGGLRLSLGLSLNSIFHAYVSYAWLGKTRWSTPQVNLDLLREHAIKEQAVAMNAHADEDEDPGWCVAKWMRPQTTQVVANIRLQIGFCNLASCFFGKITRAHSSCAVYRLLRSCPRS